MVLLYLSTRPFARGCALKISTYLQPMLYKYVLNAPLNSNPWSDLTLAGGPYLQVTYSWNQEATVALALSFKAPISTHLVRGSTATIA